MASKQKPAFGQKAAYWGVQVYEGRKKVGPYLVCEEGVESTPANALRALAKLMEAK